ncbi:hypothetical protein FA95DRAFT_1601946 [Auriscalpium vulgare]|uniref:Uncharacterized protein n=1 Tax=Auriscalpium vulgare TaxID=40419 RepID=A0ACB8S7B2_9AGAM|nr:hypothetical protein FA95DRAFT_1601946 [Auriscalpium vulgare]
MHLVSLEFLPVELLYEIQLFALSEALPLTSRRFYNVFKSAPTSIHATYILLRHLVLPPPLASSPLSTAKRPNVLTHALRYPICTQPVLNLLLASPLLPPDPRPHPAPELPRRLFRHLAPRAPGGGEWKARHAPLPFLQQLYADPRVAPPDPDAHDGYALTRAVHAGSRPLVRFLLARGASPRRKNGIAVLVAIRRRELGMVKLLVEPEAGVGGGDGGERVGKGKRRRVMDRVEVTPEMLRTAVKCGARDIAEWLMREKGCVPDMKTLGLMMQAQ